MRRSLACLALVLLPVVPAAARPSFDCARASSAVERAICADASLGRLDLDIAAAYARALTTLSGHEAARRELRDE